MAVSDALQYAYEVLNAELNKLHRQAATLFVRPPKITLVVRDASLPNGEIILTNDDLRIVARLIVGHFDSSVIAPEVEP